MDLTYKPYIRDSAFKTLSIKTPSIVINGYKPKYTTDTKSEESEEASPVESPIEEIKTTQPSTVKHSSKTFKSKEEFKSTMLPIYESILIKKGLNPLFAKALVAQDGLESAWGSKLSGKYNFGGIKGKGTIARTREVINGQDVYINDSFRDFDSIEDYANYKVDLLNNNRYKAFSGDISEFASRVHKGGYATDPNYTNALNNVIASIKHGGVLKFQEGGLLEGKKWVQNWYQNRKPIIKRNIQQNQRIPFPVAESSAGAKGVGQLTDINTKDIDPFNPYQNILRSSEVLEWFRNRNNRDIKRAIAGYNGYTKPENAKRKMKKEDSLEVVRGKRSDNYYEVLYDLIDSLKQHSTVNYPFKKPNN